MTTINDKRFQDFFREAFHKDPIANGHDHGYADEWVERINKGTLHGNKNSHAWNVSDTERQVVLRKHYPELCPVEEVTP